MLDDLREVVWSSPERMHGVPCFIRTRIPIKFAFDYLAAGDGFEAFNEAYPDVPMEHWARVVRYGGHLLNRVGDTWPEPRDETFE
ncbi:MAG: DUF433 domain-containing protein [Planctomycetota bacterium]